MDRITELLRLAEDSELPDTLPVWDICRLGYPEDQDQQQRFLEFLIRHIAKGTLATVGTVDLPEKDQPGYAVVTATVIGAGTRFRAYWEPSPPLARLAVPLLHQSALWALLDRTAFQPPPGPYLANWRTAPPTPASPLSTPAASPVEPHGPSDADLSALLSDATIGADTRKRVQGYAQRQKETHDARHEEWERWYAAIEGEITKKMNWSDLARKVKRRLGVGDSERIIRQRLSEIHAEKLSSQKKLT